MRKVLFIGVLAFMAQMAMAQRTGGGGFGHRLSGTAFTEENKTYWAPHRDKVKTYNDSSARGMREYPIKIHILRAADGTGSISVDEVQAAMAKLNANFLKAFIRFIPLEDYNYINNDDYLKFQKVLEEELTKLYDVPGVINLYIVKSIKTDKGTFNAYTYPPGGLPADRVFITQKALANGVSLTREMAHYFSLYPTQGPDDTKRSEELVNGSNCETTGDEICDTPADPKLTPDMIDERCDFQGLHKDGNAKFYRPLTNNFMCENTRVTCVNSFTRQQYRRIMYAAENFRTYLAFPKQPFSKKQLKDIEDRYGISANATVKVDGTPLSFKLDQNLYVSTRTVAGGSSLSVEITNNRKCYIYVIEGDTARAVELIYPKVKNGDKQFFEDQKTQFTAPAAGSITIDRKGGANYIALLFSKKQLPLDDLMQQLNSEEETELNLMQRLYKVFGQHIAAMHEVTYSPSELKVSGIAAERYVVPIFIQYNHD